MHLEKPRLKLLFKLQKLKVGQFSFITDCKIKSGAATPAAEPSHVLLSHFSHL